MNELIKQIKNKMELRQISDKFVKEQLNIYLKKNPKAKKFLESDYSTRSSSYKKIIKEVRAELRRSYGLFRNKVDFDELKRLIVKGEFKEILKLHSSTRERLPFYKELYKRIFKITINPKTILDLGCGLNYFSLIDYDFEYYGYDISKDEMKIVDDYIKSTKKTGTARVLNVLDTVKVRKLPRSDVAFLFKMTDVLDKGKGHKKTEEVVKAIPSRYVVVSFPTLTMSGRKMNFPRRKWIELMCSRLDYEFRILEFSNEIFYVLRK